MKRIGRFMLALVLASAAILPVAAPARAAVSASVGAVTILLDGYPLPFPVAPIIIKGTTLVPFRAISEALGVSVQWEQKTGRITAVKQDSTSKKTIILTVGSKQALVNGKAVPLALAPTVIQGSTMIPLSFFSQQFGASVSWTQSTQTVTIVSPPKDMYTLAFYALSSYDERSYLPNFDEVTFGWSRVDRSGEFTTSGAEYRWPQADGATTPESIVQDASGKGTLPSLMVYSVDGQNELTKNLEDPALQERTVQAIVDTAVEKGFGGITLDLEGLGMNGDIAKARTDYNAFVKNLSGKARQAGLKLTVVLHPLNSAYTGYDYKTLGILADQLILMAYSYGPTKTPEPLAKVDEAIQLALKQTSKDKLLLGISADSENSSTIGAKVGLAKRYGLKGIALWRLGLLQADWSALSKTVVWKE
ncbi:stalk domain-containing protein [Gorillibacterium timonense]|uniref:stalk domain-containing protein n=1 Tax=Gorillibacterium timonense TaxID=1689269 RepID=UPI00071C302D|nr:stalk domain-containing protein [Gorillibacterium timonense]